MAARNRRLRRWRGPRRAEYERLAFDGVAGYQEKWEPDLSTSNVWENWGPVLETCATVDEAIAFFRSHRGPAFAHCKLLVADRTGTSVILGAHDGKLQVDRSSRCQRLGYGAAAFDKMLAKSSEPTISNAFTILRACLQKGATKYSNVFDLKSGDIFLAPWPDRDDRCSSTWLRSSSGTGIITTCPTFRPADDRPAAAPFAQHAAAPLDQMKPIADDHPEVTAASAACCRISRPTSPRRPVMPRGLDAASLVPGICAGDVQVLRRTWRR